MEDMRYFQFFVKLTGQNIYTNIILCNETIYTDYVALYFRILCSAFMDIRAHFAVNETDNMKKCSINILFQFI